MKTTVIVDDGAYRWGADADELRATMLRLGWTREAGATVEYWTEPEREDDDATEAAYDRLCQLVSAVPGMDTANGDREPEDGSWARLPRLRCLAERGGRVWCWEGGAS